MSDSRIGTNEHIRNVQKYMNNNKNARTKNRDSIAMTKFRSWHTYVYWYAKHARLNLKATMINSSSTKQFDFISQFLGWKN